MHGAKVKINVLSFGLWHLIVP